MNLLINLIFLVIVLRLSFDKGVISFLANGKWPGLLIIQHLLFWVIFVAVSGYVYINIFGIEQAVWRLAMMLVINIPVYLLCFRVLVPDYYQKKNYGEYIRYTAAVFVISSLLRILLEPELFGTEANGQYLFITYFMQLTVTLFPSLQGISKYKLLAERELAALRLSKREAELALLKSKINPHFLFNTLNNIYSHSYAHDDSSADLIKQLSLLMQYTTYEISKDAIPVSREIQMILALRRLYQLKSHKTLDISLDFPDDELFEVIEIPPTIYLTLFENAVKYSAMGSDKGAAITARLGRTENTLTFELENTISGTRPASDESSYREAGLKVVKDLLNIHYADRFTLFHEVTEKGYRAQLSINL